MVVYTDGVHLVADNLDELHRFARGIGLKRIWFQDHKTPHYDLTTANKLKTAIEAGAVKKTAREILEMTKAKSSPLAAGKDGRGNAE